MIVSAFLALFFGGFAAGSYFTARTAYRWRNAEFVRGVLVKQGTSYHYEYRPKGQPVVTGAPFTDAASSKPDGVIDDWARLEYDPNLPEKLRPHTSKGKPSTNMQYFWMTASAAVIFGLAAMLAIVSFLRAMIELAGGNKKGEPLGSP